MNKPRLWEFSRWKKAVMARVSKFNQEDNIQVLSQQTDGIRAWN